MSAPIADRDFTDPPNSAGPLILTGNEQLAEHLVRLCAAAGTDPCLLWATPPPRKLWDSAPLVLVGDDLSDECADMTRRSGVLLFGLDLDDSTIWVRAVRIGAEHVLFLPDAQHWLLDRIADAIEGVGPPALTIGVVGGRGGAGASTLACALALAATRRGHRTMLVDADPLGGGLDVLLGGEDSSGLRWPDLAGSRGRVSGAELAEALPVIHQLSALSWDRGDILAIPPEAMRSVLAAARRRGGVVVLDLPRYLDPAAGQALEQCDVGLLVVPAELRAVVAAGRVAAAAGMRLADLRAVIRLPGPAPVPGAEIARGLGLPLAGELPPEPALVEDIERGAPPGVRSKGPLARFCSSFLDEAMPPTAAVGGGAL